MAFNCRLPEGSVLLDLVLFSLGFFLQPEGELDQLVVVKLVLSLLCSVRSMS